MAGQDVIPIVIVYLSVSYSVHSFTPEVVTIGAVLDSTDMMKVFTQTVENINSKPWILPGLKFNSTAMLMNRNPISSALAVCEQLIIHRVYTVIISHPPGSSEAPISVSYICGYYHIPVIGISARNSILSDKTVHGSYLRTVPPYSHQAEVWIDLLIHYEWSKVIVIHSSIEEGRTIFSTFQTLAERQDIEVEKAIKYHPEEESYEMELSGVGTLQSQVILLYATVEDAQVIFQSADHLNLTGRGFAWIVTEQALLANNLPAGVMGARLVNSSNEVPHIEDSVTIIAQAFSKLLRTQNVSLAPSNCRGMVSAWDSGRNVYEALLSQKLVNGATGDVSFNPAGDRLNPLYDIVVKRPSPGLVDVIGMYGDSNPTNNKLTIYPGTIQWPGGETLKPKGIRIATHLRVVTIAAQPFIEIRQSENGTCIPYDVTIHEVVCAQRDPVTGELIMQCCRGYCIEMLLHLSQTVNFTFELHLSYDDSYGAFSKRNGSMKKEWNGMIGELVRDDSDMIVAPLTINPERAQHIDFTKPFKYQGLTILVKKTPKDSSLGSFLQPFQNTLWILVGLSVHVVALVLYLLDRFSPFGRFKLAKSDNTEEDALNMSSAMWFAWGVLLNSGIGEGTPRSFSARVLGMVWAGFAMIIVASYTANLAAFLVLDRPEASISGIDDARLRNPQDSFRYATVRNSAVDMFFKRQVDLSTMYRTMDKHNYPTAEEAIHDVKTEALQAFIWDSSRLEYEAAKDCDLVTAGELFGRSGYGIGLSKNSPWKHSISVAILSFHESGYMEKLDSDWILAKNKGSPCYIGDSAPATLGLTNMAGVFMMVAGGIVAGILLIFIEIAYKRHRGLKDKELELARNAADRWRGNIEKRKLLRESRQYLHPVLDSNRALKEPPAGEAEQAKRRTLREKLQEVREDQQALENDGRTRGSNDQDDLRSDRHNPPSFTEAMDQGFNPPYVRQPMGSPSRIEPSKVESRSSVNLPPTDRARGHMSSATIKNRSFAVADLLEETVVI